MYRCCSEGDWWRALLFGQLISLFVTGTGVCSQMLAQNYGVDIPTTQSFFNYVILGIVYSLVLFAWRRESFVDVIKNKSHIYLPIALIDVEANFLVVKAYQYTSITSVMLLDCFTIPVALGLTWFFLKTRYNWRHLVGVGLCLGGLGVLVYDDAMKNGSNKPGSNPIVGDLLCLLGAVLYAVSNVGQEASVKKWPREEFLAMIGIFGSIIGGIQSLVLERQELASIAWSGPVIGLMVGFSVCMFAMYSVVPYMLRMSGSTLFNLSLLTSDAYAIIIGIFIFGKTLSVLYFVALAVIVAGLLAYNIRNEPIADDTLRPTKAGYDEIGNEVNSEEASYTDIQADPESATTPAPVTELIQPIVATDSSAPDKAS